MIHTVKFSKFFLVALLLQIQFFCISRISPRKIILAEIQVAKIFSIYKMSMVILTSCLALFKQKTS